MIENLSNAPNHPLRRLARLKQRIGSSGTQPESVEEVASALRDLDRDQPEAVAGWVDAVDSFARSDVAAPRLPPELLAVDSGSTDGVGDGDLLDALDAPLEAPAASTDRASGKMARLLAEQLLPMATQWIDTLRSASPRLPWRHEQPAIPGIVDPLHDDHGGLIHGGVILARDFRLVVRAYRFSTYAKRGARRQTLDVAAGVVEKQALDGTILETWTNAPALTEHFAVRGVDFPKPFRRIGSKKARWEGFYRPSTAAVEDYHDFLRQPSKPAFDDGLPDPMHYLGRLWDDPQLAARVTAFSRPPSPAESPENPFYQVTSAEPGLFAIESPLVSVFVPGEQSQSVLVSMARCSRLATVVGSGRKARLERLERVQDWDLRLVS